MRGGLVLGRVVDDGDGWVSGLEIKRNPIPPEPSFEFRDPLFVDIELVLLALHLGRQPLGVLDCTHVDRRL